MYKTKPFLYKVMPSQNSLLLLLYEAKCFKHYVISILRKKLKNVIPNAYVK